jgi:hypothetical protein
MEITIIGLCLVANAMVATRALSLVVELNKARGERV